MAGRPKRCMTGCAQWCPARMATPSSSSTAPTSCGWTPSTTNDRTLGLLPRGADEPDAVEHRADLVGGVGEQLLLPRRDGLAAHAPRRTPARLPARSPARSSACRPRTRAGGGAHVLRSRVTVSIMSPPPCHGGIASSSAARPYSTPTPVGPNTLWPEKAKKSQSSACTSTGRCGARLGPVHQRRRPRARAPAATIQRTGLIVPRALERCATARSRVRSVEQAVERVQVELARVGDRHRADARRPSAPRRAARARCSSGAPCPVIRISSPASERGSGPSSARRG